jgi:competence protein ComEA
MNRLKALLRNVFGFSRTETNAFLILLPLMTLLIFSEPIYRFFVIQRPDDFSKERKELDRLESQGNFQKKQDSTSLPGKDKFKFNPNTASEDDFIALGFPGNLTQRILNYRSKKGMFIIKRDLKKMYGMDSTFYAELYPFIDLPEKKVYAKAEKERPLETKKTEIPLFDLNLADTAQLKTIYGIGPVLATRIVSYRNKLGGFISARQLTEVYGLDTVAINRLTNKSFVPENFKPVTINVNQADEKALGSHPYIKFKLAKAIITYRFQHGNFKTIDDLTQIQLVTPETVNKLRPYISF